MLHTALSQAFMPSGILSLSISDVSCLMTEKHHAGMVMHANWHVTVWILEGAVGGAVRGCSWGPQQSMEQKQYEACARVEGSRQTCRSCCSASSLGACASMCRLGWMAFHAAGLDALSCVAFSTACTWAGMAGSRTSKGWLHSLRRYCRACSSRSKGFMESWGAGGGRGLM